MKKHGRAGVFVIDKLRSYGATLKGFGASDSGRSRPTCCWCARLSLYLRLIGLDWAVPDFSTLSRRQRTLKVNIPHRGSQGPLHLEAFDEPCRLSGRQCRPDQWRSDVNHAEQPGRN